MQESLAASSPPHCALPEGSGAAGTSGSGSGVKNGKWTLIVRSGVTGLGHSL